MSEGAQPAALRRRGAECADPDVLLGTTAAPNRDLEAERCTMEKGCQVNSYYMLLQYLQCFLDVFSCFLSHCPYQSSND